MGARIGMDESGKRMSEEGDQGGGGKEREESVGMSKEGACVCLVKGVRLRVE